MGRLSLFGLLVFVAAAAWLLFDRASLERGTEITVGPLPAPVFGKVTPPGERDGKAEGAAVDGTEIPNVLKRIDSLDSADGPGLARLHAEMKDSIERDPETLHQYLLARLDKLSEIPEMHSFFLVKSYVKHHPDPAPLVAKLLRQKTREEKETEHSDGEHFHVVDRLGLVKGFALKNWRERYSAGEAFPESVRSVLLPRVADAAREEANLAVVREAMRVVITVDGGSSVLLRDIAKGRRKEDRFAFADLLQAH